MLERLFNSELKIRLINLFLSQTEEKLFSYAEIAKSLGLKGKNWRRDLDDLTNLALFKLVNASDLKLESDKEEGKFKKETLKTKELIKTDKTFLVLNKDFFIFPEIKSLFAKSRVFETQKIFTEMKETCNPKLILLTGKFINKKDSLIDLLVVGNISRRHFLRFLSELELIMGEELNYSIMTEEEFKYRRYVMDIFLYNVISNHNIIMTGSISELSFLQKTKEDNEVSDKTIAR